MADKKEGRIREINHQERIRPSFANRRVLLPNVLFGYTRPPRVYRDM